MWRLDKDPYLSSTFANLTILDRPPDYDRLVRRMERATHVVPRLRRRVQSVPANLTAPMWVDDPDFDIRYHVRRISLPKPGNMRQLLDLTALIAMDAFDRTRPLWQFWIIDGLRGGRSAFVEKLHHTITDGEGGVQLAMQFLDLERDAPEPPAIDAIDDADEPVTPEVWRELLSGSLRVPAAMLRQVKDMLADPNSIPGTGGAAAETVRGIIQQLGDVESARSPLWTARSLRRRFEVLRAPFRDTRDAARRLGGTLNTAFVTAAADAAANYHRRLGAPVEHLRASMAVSTRTEQSGANAFSLVRLNVPTGDMPIDERFRLIHEASSHARQSSATAALETIAAISSALPTSVITRLARQQSQTIDFATSNVKGTPIPVFIAGAQLLENYPVGPLLGVAFNLTLLSYDGSLDMGVNIDSAAVTEPELLRDLISDAFTALASA